MSVLRRFLAILLLAVSCLPIALSPLALGQSTEAGLPPCCRRLGQHHCAMSIGERTQAAAGATSPAWKAPVERCPYCPATVAPGVHRDAGWLRTAFAAVVGLPPAASAVPRAECAHRLARERARGKRGPPISFFV